MKKILPITTEIPIKTYNNIAYPLSIIFSNCKSPEDWLFLNSFSLKYGTEVNDITLDLPYNMDWECFDKKIILPMDTTIENIINEILDDRYVYIAVDEMYIPYRTSYQIKSFVHDILVYGFDTDNTEFMLIGFDQKQKYNCHNVSFSTLNKSIISANDFLKKLSSTYEFFGNGNNFSLKIRNLSVSPISCSTLVNKLNAHFNSSAFKSHSGYLCYSGLQIYKKLLNDLDALIDYRNWNIIKEHKKFIILYILNNFPELTSELFIDDRNSNNILWLADCCLALALKYNVDKKSKTLDKLKNEAFNLFCKEEKLCTILLDKLQNSISKRGSI